MPCRNEFAFPATSLGAGSQEQEWWPQQKNSRKDVAYLNINWLGLSFFLFFFLFYYHLDIGGGMEVLEGWGVSTFWFVYVAIHNQCSYRSPGELKSHHFVPVLAAVPFHFLPIHWLSLGGAASVSICVVYTTEPNSQGDVGYLWAWKYAQLRKL